MSIHHIRIGCALWGYTRVPTDTGLPLPSLHIKKVQHRNGVGLFVIRVHFRYHISIIRKADTMNLFTFHDYRLLSKNRPFSIREE